MVERRKLRRKYLAFFTRIFDRGSGQLLGHLADITTEGMMVISEKPIKTGQEYKLQIDLSDSYFPKQRLDFHAFSIWCRPDVDPNFWNTGFQLSNMADDDAAIIELIVQEYGIRD
jgi:hypothetical protein